MTTGSHSKAAVAGGASAEEPQRWQPNDDHRPPSPRPRRARRARSSTTRPRPTTIASTVQVSTLSEYLDGWVKRIRSGDSGVLPVVGGLIVVVIIFQLQSSVFLSAANLVNLLEQAGPFIMLGLAEVFVLLLGEIDLSIGYSGAVGAAIMTILAAPPINDRLGHRDRRRPHCDGRDRVHPGPDHHPPAATVLHRHARRTPVLGRVPDLDHQQPERE